MRGQNLDGYRAIEPRVAPSVDFSHAARPERRLNFVRAKFCACSKGHACRLLYWLAALRHRQ